MCHCNRCHCKRCHCKQFVTTSDHPCISVQDNTVGTSATPKSSNATRDRLLASVMEEGEDKDEGDRSWLETSLNNASYTSAAAANTRDPPYMIDTEYCGYK